MRITANAFTDSFINQVNSLTAQQYKLQNQMTTGLSITASSDNPEGMQNTLNDLAKKSAQTQYSNNITTLQTHANSIYSVLQSLQTLTSNAGEIATLGTSDTKSQSDLDNYATQINQLLSQAVSLANTKDPATGQYLFGGTASDQPPFTTTTDADGNITGVTYNGNSSVNQSEITQGSTVSVDVPGANTSSSGVRGLFVDSQSGADLFNHLISLRNDLQAGDTSAISTDSSNLQNDVNNVSYQVANNGTIQTRLNNAASFVSSTSTTLDTMISNQSSADLVTTMTEFSQAQNAYQAALESGTKIMQMSILNYL